MNGECWRRFVHRGVFIVLLVLAVGYFPAQIGRNLLCMAMMACPFELIRGKVDFVLGCISKRGMLFLWLLICMGYYPLRDFGILMERLTMIVECFTNR